MIAFTFITFVLCILIWTISWRLFDYHYNHDFYNSILISKNKNWGNGVYANDIENGLYYHNIHKLNNIKMLNKSQSHSHPIYY
jgi:hypothetical protein